MIHNINPSGGNCIHNNGSIQELDSCKPVHVSVHQYSYNDVYLLKPFGCAHHDSRHTVTNNKDILCWEETYKRGHKMVEFAGQH